MKLFKALRFSLLLLALTSVQSATAAIEYVIESGQLIGANGIMVDLDGDAIEEVYNVSFADETFDDLYPDGIPPFIQNSTDSSALSSALLSQVLVNTPMHQFDSDPSLVNGCVLPSVCSIATPAFTRGTNLIYAFLARNGVDDTQDGLNSGYMSRTTAPVLDTETFAVWTVPTPVSAVPEPATFAMMLTGVMMLGVLTRRRKLM